MNNGSVSIDIRKAIIIGINKFESSEFQPLNGAENDAKEIKERFVKYGKFDVPYNYYLLGSDATRKNILKIVSEVFLKEDKCDLVTFYFSGYAIIDEENDKAYLAPYDMDPEFPFVSGIDVEDLNNVINKSKNKTSIIIILDCCYAGIVTKDPKKYDSIILENQNLKIYASNLEKMLRDKDDRELYSNEQGKVILASSEPNAVSREKYNCRHINSDDPPHTHGAFSYHLIEGLDGKAVDPNTGIITIDNLQRYIENQMISEHKQKPIYLIAKAWNIQNKKIAVAQETFGEKITKLIAEVDDIIKRKDPMTNRVHLLDLQDAAKKVQELIKLSPNDKKINRLQNLIDDALNMYKQPAIAWIEKNMQVAGPKINEIRYNLYEELPDLIDRLSFDELENMPDYYLYALIYLFTEVEKNKKFDSPEDPNLKVLVSKLRSTFNNEKSPLTKIKPWRLK